MYDANKENQKTGNDWLRLLAAFVCLYSVLAVNSKLPVTGILMYKSLLCGR